MRRRHLIELHEQPWFPAVWRDLVTDFLSFFFRTFRPYRVAAPVLAEALERSGSDTIIDLCSGAGAPVLSLLPALRALGRSPRRVTLTDLYPNRDAFRAVVAAGDGSVAALETPVDAADVPAELAGFRTLFTSFHHFAPPDAREILVDARRKGEGIGIFEFTERNLVLWLIPVLMIPLVVAVCTPFIRPLTWRRLLWTYVVPVVPLVAAWDGFVSNLRSYTRDELLELADAGRCDDYRWRTDRVRSLGLSCVTYLVGWPTEAELSRPR
ncbi:MAG: class I SAM-dependent methyltransferase [Holophagae bacterium]|jgi:hypothetical protein